MAARLGTLLVLLMFPLVASASPRQEETPRQPTAEAAQSQSLSPPASRQQSSPGSFDDAASIARIRKMLEEQPQITFTQPDPNVPRFRVEIKSLSFTYPTFVESYKVPVSPVPQPFGGSDYYNMMRLITPAQYWGSAPFTNADLLKIWGLSGAYGLAGALIKKGIDARASAAASRAHQEVLDELAALEAQNARLAADGDAARKKQAEQDKKDKKKKDEKKDSKK